MRDNEITSIIFRLLNALFIEKNAIKPKFKVYNFGKIPIAPKRLKL